MYVYSSLFKMKPWEYVQLVALAVMTTGFITIMDDPVDADFIERDDFYVKAGIGFSKIGEAYDKASPPYALVGLTIPVLTAGFVFKDDKLLETARLMAESYLMAGAITYFGKRAFGRYRPFTGEGPTKFEPFKIRSASAARSFPSGHSTLAFAVASVIAKQYDRWWIGIPAYTIAASVAVQRIESHNHWLADVIVGGVIGNWVGTTLVNRYKPRSKTSAVNPYIMENRLGIMFSF